MTPADRESLQDRLRRSAPWLYEGERGQPRPTVNPYHAVSTHVDKATRSMSMWFQNEEDAKLVAELPGIINDLLSHIRWVEDHDTAISMALDIAEEYVTYRVFLNDTVMTYWQDTALSGICQILEWMCMDTGLPMDKIVSDLDRKGDGLWTLYYGDNHYRITRTNDEPNIVIRGD